MFSLTRFAGLAYILIIFLGGYLAVSTLSGLWHQAASFERLATLSAQSTDALNDTLLVFDAIEPTAGAAK
jgi:hypothetical protein